MDERKNVEFHEDENSVIVKNNVAKMQTKMEDYLIMESVGGNAGMFEEDGISYSAVGVNCWVDKENGETIEFTNEIERDPKKYVRVLMRLCNFLDSESIKKMLALSQENFQKVAKHPSQYKVLDLFPPDVGLSERALNNIKESIKQYNEGFKKPEF